MHSTQELCRALQRRHKITSGYKLAKLMGVANQTALNWLQKTRSFSDESAVKCAELLSLNPTYCLACARYEQAKDPVMKAFWKKLAENAPDFELDPAA